MELSILIAKIYGIALTVIGLGLILNGKYYIKTIEDMMKSPGVMYLGGTMALVVGFLIITYHNIWVKDWRVLVTIVGWIGFIKGITLLVFPGKMPKITKVFLNKGSFMIWGFIALILGLILGYFGFMA